MVMSRDVIVEEDKAEVVLTHQQNGYARQLLADTPSISSVL
jgi:ABC-type dipeptide/oligopeptide/nickel transport system ATPase subunit